MADRPVTLAAIVGAHGVTGEVRLKLFGESVETLRGHKAFNAQDHRGSLTATKIKSDNKGGAIARFAEVSDRTAAEALRGTVLTVPRSSLPDLDEDEFYHADLIGLPAVADDGETVGTVSDVMNYGATDIVEITKADGKRFMAPLISAAVPEWDEQRLVIAKSFVD